MVYFQGTVVVTDDAGNTIFSHSVEPGDIWRMCQTKDEPIKVSLVSGPPKENYKTQSVSLQVSMIAVVVNSCC